jgi:hypothetical protein
MTIRNQHSVLCCILAFLLPVSTVSAQNAPAGGAILNPNGIVTVNGTLINNSSALQDNDTVSTGPESVVHITSPGSNTLLGADSVAAYSHDSISLTAGEVSIATSGGMSTQVHKLRFGPAKPEVLTKYEVRIDGCEVTVIARTGSVLLPDGGVLDQGNSRRSSDKDCEMAKQTPINRAPGAAVSGLSPTTGYWVIGGIAAAGGTAAAVVLLTEGGRKAVSPSRP